MKRILISTFLAAFVSLSAIAAPLPPDEAGTPGRLSGSPRHGEWVNIPAGTGDSVDLWVVYPERSDPAPVVIVIHEIFGLTDWARAVADSFAAEGFIAIAPDFLSRKGPQGAGTRSVTTEQARALMGTLTTREIMSRLDAAAGYGTSLPAATKSYGVVGFCWGGAVSFGYATHQPQLGASVVYYGTSPATASLAEIRAPVLGLYGGNDARVNATVPAADAEMKRLGKRFETAFYDGAGHAFLRQLAGQNGANLKAAELAWPRTLAFLRELLEVKSTTAIPGETPFILASDFCEDDECLPEMAHEESHGTPVAGL